MTISESAITSLAKIAHQANKAFCETSNEHCQENWEAISDNHKESACDGVRFLIADSSRTPQDLHDNWIAWKKKDGWTYGPDKDPDAKTHPCLVPYDDLSVEEQYKDHLFHAIVTSYTTFLDHLPSRLESHS